MTKWLISHILQTILTAHKGTGVRSTKIQNESEESMEGSQESVCRLEGERDRAR